jgi:peptidoglycan/xylan/chitin deacetylase (PgdA/CDA1 family)
MYHKFFKQGFELGGHTVSHPQDMKNLDDDQLCYEILQTKFDIEKLTGRACTKFCYPRGRFDERVKGYVRAAGYEEARTTKVGNWKRWEGDKFETPTSVHFYPREEYHGLNVLEYAKSCFDLALFQGHKCFFSLWGHSWEIEKLGLWNDFEELLKYMRSELSPV